MNHTNKLYCRWTQILSDVCGSCGNDEKSQAADNGLMGDLLAAVMPRGEAHGRLCLYTLIEKD